MTEITTTQGFSQRCQAVLEEARQIKANSPDWVSFFRETLGVDGVARSVFGTQNEYLQFEKTKEFEEIQKMVSALRGDKPAKQAEETKVITVRLPESLHESLKAEAAEHKTSMNKLCISKLLRALEAAAESSRSTPAEPAMESAPPLRSEMQPSMVQATTIPMDTHSRRKSESGFRSTFEARQSDR